MTDLRQIASQYIEKGLFITPSQHKKPYLESYYELTEEQVLEPKAWSRATGLNLITGKRSGIVVLDIDVRKNEKPELYEEIKQALPPAFVSRIGNPHKMPSIFFQYSGEESCKWKNIDVEFFGEVGNVVLPPTPHPDFKGHYFSWVDRSLLDVDVDDLPTFPKSLFSYFDALEARYKTLKKENPTAMDNDFEPGRCRHGSHNHLSALAVALRKEGYAFNTVRNKIDAEDKKYNEKADRLYFNCPTRKEFKGVKRKDAIEMFIGQVFANHSTGDRETDQSEFENYRDFFDSNLKDPRKCKLNNNCYHWKDDRWQPIVNRIDSMQSYCKEAGLKHTQMKMHLFRYLENLEPSLLVELPEWDGKDWIKEIVSFITFKDEKEKPIFENYFKYWIARVFARLENPINQNIFLLIRGDQGIGKDRLIYNLFHNFDPYYSPFSVQPNKEVDTWHQVASHLILHLQEFDQTSKLGIPFLKELITTNAKEYRLPYDRAPEKRLMYGSFISTANVDNLFRDTTGNRRFAVFDFESIDWSYPKDFGLQIIAQGVQLFKAGYDLDPVSKLYMDNKVAEMTPEDMDGAIIDMWQDRTTRLCQKHGKEMLRFYEVESVLSDISRVSGWKVKTILSLLRRRGYAKTVGGNAAYFKNAQKISSKHDDRVKKVEIIMDHHPS